MHGLEEAVEHRAPWLIEITRNRPNTETSQADKLSRPEIDAAALARATPCWARTLTYIPYYLPSTVRNGAS